MRTLFERRTKKNNKIFIEYRTGDVQPAQMNYAHVILALISIIRQTKAKKYKHEEKKKKTATESQLFRFVYIMILKYHQNITVIETKNV